MLSSCRWEDETLGFHRNAAKTLSAEQHCAIALSTSQFLLTIYSTAASSAPRLHWGFNADTPKPHM